MHCKLAIIVVAIGAQLTNCESFKIFENVAAPHPLVGATNTWSEASERHFNAWQVDDEDNVWERSGLFEGDIMVTENVGNQKNVVLNETLRWPNSTVPFYIYEDDFDDDEKKVILLAIAEYHNRTCVRFQPYREDSPDSVDYIVIRGNDTGCWSHVGRQENGQIVNLHTPKCVRHGTVIHELLHALGLYHQQSTSDRDDFVRINWENIQDGHEFNFNKYNSSEVTSYGIQYDYGSVMHYSGKAFSKNDLPTIESLNPNITTLGQRVGLSEKDVLKINQMYGDACEKGKVPGEVNSVDQMLNKVVEMVFGYVNQFG